MSSDPRIGTVIGSYHIEGLLGRGGMGVVYRAEDQRPGTRGRKVALKILAPELSSDERFRQRFERESQMAASIDHPNIVPVYEAGEVEGLLYIAMRHVQGEDLRTAVQREGALPPARALSVIVQVAAALDTAHARGLVHRDVKPGNILLVGAEDPDSPPHVYLTDFGLTKRTDSHSGLTVTGQFVGTIEYVAPEQIEGKEVDSRTDIYALGCVFFECLTGEPPFKADQEAALLWAHLTQDPPKASERRAGVPPALDEVVGKALAKSKEDRYATCREMVAAARGAISGQPVSPTSTPTVSAPLPPAPPPVPPAAPVSQPPAPPPPFQPAPPGPATAPPVSWQAPPPPGPPRRRNTTLWVLIIVGILAVVGAGIGVFLATTGGGDGPSPPPPNGPTPQPLDTTGEFPSEAEQALLGQIPPELQTPACTRATPPEGALAAVDCFTDTPQLLTYTLFADQPSMQAFYDAEVSTAGVTPQTGNCAAGEASEDSWLNPGGAESGRLLCFTDQFGSSVIVWTHDTRLIVGESTRPTAEPIKHYNFWAGIADYVGTPPA
jgi:serine/threonine-protein kinase